MTLSQPRQHGGGLLAGQPESGQPSRAIRQQDQLLPGQAGQLAPQGSAGTRRQSKPLTRGDTGHQQTISEQLGPSGGHIQGGGQTRFRGGPDVELGAGVGVAETQTGPGGAGRDQPGTVVAV